MSNIKKSISVHPAVSHFNKSEPGVSPPQYQPPPRPPGILKPYTSQPQPNYLRPVSENDKYSNAKQKPNLDSYSYSERNLEPKPAYINPPQYPAPPPVIKTNNKPATPTNLNPNTPKVEEQQIPGRGHSEMLKFVRINKPETETAAGGVPNFPQEQNQQQQNKVEQTSRRIQNYINEIRALKEANQRLSDDNQELRDLCCFLDDDRQKGRKLAREWQRFGRYTASVMRQEVSAYQNKLRQLENKQQELIKDNLELKELCLYLDEERNATSTCPSCGHGLPVRPNHRDDGDGSSSSTNADEPVTSPIYPGSNMGPSTQGRTEGRDRLLEESIQRQRNIFNEQIIQYVRHLEHRVKVLEKEKQVLIQKLLQTGFREEDLKARGIWGSSEDDSINRPEAVIRALQVLEVRELMERSGHGDSAVSTQPNERMSDIDEGEKALVMEMCNVVWRKLEEGPAAR
ncbi:hypothetical protein RUM44_012175 [Polyplax serrata]|uniref:4Fe-4S Mo/W bis-MGD-type domain-containing protein n=1 Tax=Polyplax serrata TaxID=468196 RepID=A0ABR1BCQ1_POLSC